MMTRRSLLGSACLSTTVLHGQKLTGEPEGRIAPISELVNIFEVEAMAKRKLSEETFSLISGSNRAWFDRVTFRPRLMVDTSKLDLTADLFGEKLFAPILAAPISEQQRFHGDGELASMRGTAAAKTLMVVSSKSSYPLEKIAAESKSAFWFQVYPEPGSEEKVRQAVDLGCKAICVTASKFDWTYFDQLRKSIKVPVLLKGIMSAEEAELAVKRGASGIIVSNHTVANHGAPLSAGLAAPIETLSSIADAVGKRTTIMIDGSFRRGTDILKALAFGANAVLIGRPAMWGLASYGDAGVQTIFETLQTELARNMALCGRPNLKSIDRGLVKIHAR